MMNQQLGSEEYLVPHHWFHWWWLTHKKEEPANTHVTTHQLLGGEKREEALSRVGSGSTLWVPEFSEKSFELIYIAWATSPIHVYSSKTGPEPFHKFRLQSHRPTDPLCGFSSHTCTQQFSWGRAAKLATDVEEGELQSWHASFLAHSASFFCPPKVCFFPTSQ